MARKGSLILGVCNLVFVCVFVCLLAVFTSTARAQVVVTPSQVPDASRQVFTASVPSSRPYPTIALKLFLPQELTNVVPDVKSGWKVALKNKLTSSTTTPTEIDWTGGSIPTGEGDTFQFSADVPDVSSGSVMLVWRAYQTYSDEVVISWDQMPSANAVVSSTGLVTATTTNVSGKTPAFFGPYSQTAVVGGESAAEALTNPSSFSNAGSASFDISLISLILSAMAVFIAWRSRLR